MALAELGDHARARAEVEAAIAEAGRGGLADEVEDLRGLARQLTQCALATRTDADLEAEASDVAAAVGVLTDAAGARLMAGDPAGARASAERAWALAPWRKPRCA
ncbi:MAG: hypothetical protein R3F60_32450 [bacterium]